MADSAPAAPPPAAPSTSAAPPPAMPKSDPGAGSPPGEDYTGALAELETMDKEPDAPPPKQPERGERGEDGKFKPRSDTKAPKTETKPVEPPSKPDLKVPDTKSEKPVNAKDLRTAYDSLRQKVDTEYRPKISELERTVADYKSKEPPNLQELQSRIAATEKQNAELLEEIRYVNFRRHPEFLNRYQKPYEEAWTKAVAEFGQLTRVMDDGSLRKGTPEDLLALANTPLDELDDVAEKWFGKRSARVIRHVEKVRDLAEAQDKALNDARKAGEDHFNNMNRAQVEQGQKVVSAYNTANQELAGKYPKWFAETEGDEKGNTLLRNGFAYVDSVLNNNSNLDQVQKAQRLAVVRNKAANHDRLALQMKELRAENAELKAKLDEFEKSEPDIRAHNPPSGSRQSFIDDANAEIESLEDKTLV